MKRILLLFSALSMFSGVSILVWRSILKIYAATGWVGVGVHLILIAVILFSLHNWLGELSQYYYES